MLMFTNRRFVKRGSGFFDSLINIGKKIFGSPITGKLLSSAASVAGKQLVKNILKQPPMEFNNYTTAIPPSPAVAIQAAIKSGSPLVTEKAQEILSKYTPLTPERSEGSAISLKDYIKKFSKSGNGLKVII